MGLIQKEKGHFDVLSVVVCGGGERRMIEWVLRGFLVFIIIYGIVWKLVPDKWFKRKEPKGVWLLRCGTCDYEGMYEGDKPTECPKCGLKAEKGTTTF